MCFYYFQSASLLKQKLLETSGSKILFRNNGWKCSSQGNVEFYFYESFMITGIIECFKVRN